MSSNKKSNRKSADGDDPKVFVDRRSRTLTYVGGISWEGAGEFLQYFQDLCRSAEPIRLQLCTEGGDVDPGMAMYEAIRRSKSDVTMTVLGTCASMGTVILQAADTRLITAHSTLMHHRGNTSNGSSQSPTEHLRSAAFDVKRYDYIDKLVYSRTDGKCCKTWGAFVKLTTKSIWMTAAEALAKGFVDDVV